MQNSKNYVRRTNKGKQLDKTMIKRIKELKIKTKDTNFTENQFS